MLKRTLTAALAATGLVLTGVASAQQTLTFAVNEGVTYRIPVFCAMCN